MKKKKEKGKSLVGYRFGEPLVPTHLINDVRKKRRKKAATKKKRGKGTYLKNRTRLQHVINEDEGFI